MTNDTKDSYWFGAQRLRRRRLIQSAITGGVGVLVTGCGEKGKSSSQSSTAGASRAGSAAQPRNGGTFSLLLTDNKRGFDPMAPQAGSTFDSTVALSAYRNLLMYATGPDADPDKHEVVGDLVTKGEHADPSTVTLKSVHGAKFHDRTPVNGRDVTSADIKFSIERMKARQFVYKNGYLNIESVQTPDAQTATLKLSKPDADTTEALAHWYLRILPQDGGAAKPAAPRRTSRPRSRTETGSRTANPVRPRTRPAAAPTSAARSADFPHDWKRSHDERRSGQRRRRTAARAWPAPARRPARSRIRRAGRTRALGRR